jgi:hypothetical protein
MFKFGNLTRQQFTPSTQVDANKPQTVFMLKADKNASTGFTDKLGNEFTQVSPGVIQPNFGPFYKNYGIWFPGDMGGGTFVNFSTNTFNTSTAVTVGGVIGRGPYTIEFWMRADSFNTSGDGGYDRRIFSHGRDIQSGMQVVVAGGNNTIGSIVTPQGGLYLKNNSILIGTTMSVCDMKWHHIAFVRNGASLSSYVDGILKQTVSNSDDWMHNGVVTFGAYADVHTYVNQYQGRYHGFLTNFRISLVPLYTSNFNPPTEPLTTSSSQLTASTSTQLLIFSGPDMMREKSINGITPYGYQFGANQGSARGGADLGTSTFSRYLTPGPFDDSTATAQLSFMTSALFNNSGGQGGWRTSVRSSKYNIANSDFCLEWWAMHFTSDTNTFASEGHFDAEFLNIFDGFSGYYSGLTIKNSLTGGGAYARDFATPNSGLPPSKVPSWTHFVVHRTNGHLAIFANGIRQTMGQSIQYYGSDWFAIASTNGRSSSHAMFDVKLTVGQGLISTATTLIDVPTGPQTLTWRGANPANVAIWGIDPTKTRTFNQAVNTAPVPSAHFFNSARSNPETNQMSAVSPFTPSGWSYSFNGVFPAAAGTAGADATRVTSSSTTFLSGWASQTQGVLSWTWEGWINPASTNDRIRCLWQSGAANQAAGRTGLWLTSSTQVYFQMTSVTATITVNTATIQPGVWSHIAISSSASGNVWGYVNGVGQYLGSWLVRPSPGQNWYIGHDGNFPPTGGPPGIGLPATAGNNNFGGFLSNFRWTNSQEYSGVTITVPTQPLRVTTQTVMLCMHDLSIDLIGSTDTVSTTLVPGNLPWNVNGSLKAVPYSPFQFPGRADSSAYGGSVFLDGTNYLTSPVGYIGELGNRSWAFETWFYPLVGKQGNLTTQQTATFFSTYGQGVSAAGNTVWGQNNRQNGRNQFAIGYNTNNQRINFLHNASATVGQGLGQNSGQYSTTGTWQHIFVQNNTSSATGGQIEVWVNGIPLDSATVATSFVNYEPGSPSIGGSIQGQGLSGTPWPTGFYGYMTGVRLVQGRTLRSWPTRYPIPRSVTTATTDTTILLNFEQWGIYDPHARNRMIITPLVDNNDFMSAYGTQHSFRLQTFTNTQFDYLSVPYHSSLELGSTDFTVEGWFNTTSTNRQTIYHSSSASDFSFAIDFSALNTTTKVGMWASSDSLTWNMLNANTNTNSGYVGTGTTAIAALTWNHFAVSRKNNTFQLYINGQLDRIVTNTTGTISPKVGFTRNIGMGVTQNTPFNGWLTNFRVTKGLAVYNTNPTPQTPFSTTTNTLFQTLTTASLVDASRNAIVITNISVTTSTTNPFTTSSVVISGVFPGNGYLSFSGTAVTIGTGPYTLECWIYYTGNDAGTYTIFGTSGSSFNLLIQAGNLIFSPGSAQITTNFRAFVFANKWTHIMLARWSTTSRLFVDGTQVGIYTGDANNYTLSTLYIGSNATPGNYFVGNISSFRIQNTNEYFVTTATIYNGNLNYSGTSTVVAAGAFTVPTNTLTVLQSTGTNIEGIFTASYVSLLTAQTYNYNTASNYQIIDRSPNNLLITKKNIVRPTIYMPFSNYVVNSVSTYPTQAIRFWEDSGGVSNANQYIRVQGDEAPWLNMYGLPFTAECWIYVLNRYLPTNSNGFTTGLGILGKGTNSSTGWELRINASNQLEFMNGGSVGVTGSVISGDQWYHVAFVRESLAVNSSKLYVNGVVAGTGVVNNIFNDVGDLMIGNLRATGGNRFYGWIEDVRISKFARYTGNFTPPSTPLPDR